MLELLEHFKTYLSDLKRHRGPPNAPPTPGNEFKQTLTNALLIGYVLQNIAKSAALGMRLRTTEAMLGDHRRDDMPMPMPEGNAETDEERGEEQDERDEELQAVQPSAIRIKENKPDPLPLWKSHRNWLRLMLIHFDSVDVLVKI